MGNKNKTNPQISKFEFITIKISAVFEKIKKKKKRKRCLYQNHIELLNKIHTLKKLK